MKQFKVKWLLGLALVTLFLVSAGHDSFAIRRARRRSGSMVYRVRFTANVNARIFVDGRRKLFTTAKKPTFKINGGAHNIRLVPLNSSYQPLNTTINVRRNQTFSFNLKRRGEVRSSVFSITINSNVPAKVYINNQYKGNDGRQIQLTPGTYNLRVIANSPGYRAINTRIRVNRSQTFNYTLMADSKRIVFNTNVPARVYINNRYRGMDGAQIMLPAGSFNVRIQATTPGYRALNTRINVSRNQAFNFTLMQDSKRVVFNTNVPAKIYINNRQRGMDGAAIMLPNGTYRLRIIPTTPGYRPLMTRIRVMRNQTFNFTLRAPMGTVRVNLPRRAILRVNGQRRAFRPGYALRLSAGTYNISIRYYGLSVEKTIQVQAGRNSSLSLRLEVENR